MITSADLRNRADFPPLRGFRGRITIDEATQAVTETPAEENPAAAALEAERAERRQAEGPRTRIVR